MVNSSLPFIKIHIFVIMIFFSSCAAFKEGLINYKTPNVSAKELALRKSLCLDVAYFSKMYEREKKLSPKLTDLLKMRIKETFELSKNFNSIEFSDTKIASSNFDYFIKIEIIFSSQGKYWPQYAWSMASLLTLFIVPYWDKSSIDFVAQVFDQDGKLLAKYQFSERVTQVMQIFLIFAAPFHPYLTFRRRIIEAMSKNLLLKMKDDKLI